MVQQQQKNASLPAGPDPQILGRAEDVAVRLKMRARDADRERELPAENIRDLHEAGLMTLNISAEFGGTQADLITQMAVYEIIGGACASTAWCLGNHGVMCTRLQAMLGSGPNPYIRSIVEDGALISHGAIPEGTTRAVEGGFVSSGRWPFISGSNRAGWLWLSTLAPGPPPGWKSADGAAEPPKDHNRWMLVRPGEPGVRIEQTWQAMAIRASMSNDVVLEEVFIPEERAPVAMRPAPHQSWLPDGPVSLRVPSRSRPWMPAMMLGVAQAALTETIEFAKPLGMSVGGQPRISMPGNQFAVADAAMAIEAGRAFLHQEGRAIMAKAAAGGQFTPEDINRMDMAGLVARENAQAAVDRLFSIQGAHGLFETGNFERYYRDVRIGTLHAVSTPDGVRELVGKHLFGVPADVQPRWG